MEQIIIDNEAKVKIDLSMVRDSARNPYYIGKLQFPGTLEFDQGASFMVFVAESGVEQLHIAPIDPSRMMKARESSASIRHGRFSIDLRPMQDQKGKVYYVGEVIGLTQIKLRAGIFFAIFVSIAGQEQIQISHLIAKPRMQRDERSKSSPFNQKVCRNQ